MKITPRNRNTVAEFLAQFTESPRAAQIRGSDMLAGRYDDDIAKLMRELR